MSLTEISLIFTAYITKHVILTEYFTGELSIAKPLSNNRERSKMLSRIAVNIARLLSASCVSSYIPLAKRGGK